MTTIIPTESALSLQADIPNISSRKKPTQCKYCNKLGHNTRSCYEPVMIHNVHVLMSKIAKYMPIDDIDEWLRPMDTNMIRMLLCQYAYCTYSKIKSPKERLISIILETIKQTYQRDETNARIALSNYVETPTFVFIEWYEQANLEELYIEYCNITRTQFIRNEYERLCQMIETKHVPETFIPIPVLRMYVSFLRYQFHMYTMMRDRKIQSNIPVIIYDIKQVITFDVETIDCPICMESTSTPEILITDCKHSFCNSCMQTIIYRSDTTRCNCPLCRKPIKKMTRYILS
jgi:hypothetical protein